MMESCHTYDLCCFYYFVRNSLVALLEALCAREPVMAQTWMSLVTSMTESCPSMTESCGIHVNETYHTNEWGMSHTWISHASHANETWHTHASATSHIWTSQSTDKWVTSNIWMSPVTHWYESVMSQSWNQQVISLFWMSPATYWKSTCHACEWLMAHTWNEIQTYRWVTSLICIRHVASID